MIMNQSLKTIFSLSLLLIMTSYSAPPDRTARQNFKSSDLSERIKITIGSTVFTATLQNHETTAAFKSMLPLTISMKELNGNEKYHLLPKKLPSNASYSKIIHAGDIMLFGVNTLVIFYESFSPTYPYTTLGHIDNPGKLKEALGTDNIKMTFENL